MSAGRYQTRDERLATLELQVALMRAGVECQNVHMVEFEGGTPTVVVATRVSTATLRFVADWLDVRIKNPVLEGAPTGPIEGGSG